MLAGPRFRAALARPEFLLLRLAAPAPRATISPGPPAEAPAIGGGETLTRSHAARDVVQRLAVPPSRAPMLRLRLHGRRIAAGPVVAMAAGARRQVVVAGILPAASTAHRPDPGAPNRPEPAGTKRAADQPPVLRLA